MKTITQTARTGRRIAGRAQRDHILDPYHLQQKLHEPTACRRCGAVYQHGRWHWGRQPDNAHEELCPACRRIEEQLPAGIVTLHGAVGRHGLDEIIGLIRNEENAEKGEHPLNRIIDIEQTADDLAITTTDIHLPRRIGAAIKRAYHGILEMHFDPAGYFVRIDWRPPN